MLNVSIDTRATRSHDAVLTVGQLSLTFKGGNVKMNINHFAREANKQLIATIEQIVSRYVGETVTKKTLEDLAEDLKPIVDKFEKYVA